MIIEHGEAAKRAFESYRTNKADMLVHHHHDEHEGEPYDCYVYESFLRETSRAVRIRITTFWIKGGEVRMQTAVSERDTYLCVNGPKAGKRIVASDTEEYILYKCRRSHEPQRYCTSCVFVHKPTTGEL